MIKFFDLGMINFLEKIIILLIYPLDLFLEKIGWFHESGRVNVKLKRAS